MAALFSSPSMPPPAPLPAAPEPIPEPEDPAVLPDPGDVQKQAVTKRDVAMNKSSGRPSTILTDRLGG